MCELIPPRADLTEDQWLRTAGPGLADAAVPDDTPDAAAAAHGVHRRTLLGGAVAGAALAALPFGAQQRAVAAARAGAADRFPLPSAPGPSGEYAVLITGDAGTGKAEQYAVTAAAREICRTEGVGLAVGLGDNIYENGPESDHDSEFDEKFERPNTGIDVPWLMVLGNHDCSGLVPGSGGDPSRGDREVAYAATSRRWYMPSRYYNVTLPAGGGRPDPLIEFFALDTNPVASSVVQLDPHYRWDGPYMREQRRWLDTALRASRARWKVVLGHHPYLNNGKHGSAGSYDGFVIGHYTSGVHLKELYEEVVCGRADVIMSGHDHTLQILEPTDRTRGTRQLVCGAASKTGDGTAHFTHPAAWQDFSRHGFMLLKVSAGAMTIDAYTVDVATKKARLAHRTRTTRPVAAGVPVGAPAGVR
ncbi:MULTISPECIES: metallophosphoesterase [Streptomyces]|uniref:Calcineurin n=3 Tax=Streptomyces TaxID=1883 RepID=A0A8A1UUL2_STRR1|nr:MULTISPECIES: metallophosphoesterase [Streptomyces]KEF09012.1 calcineurin [Streptomyces rimosus]KUJ34561.1 calcineurin [Streptomyces rimosus subsp. rimosus]QDA03257.1 calcineurin [Streptomyces rimosus]QEV74536.1 calcineurin [Streptomyces rimosus]QGY68167.1 calcineurin [Streptomyces rimosus R6-500]